MLYGFIWFAVFGGAGLRMERQAANLGIDCVSSTDAMGEDTTLFFLVRCAACMHDAVVQGEH